MAHTTSLTQANDDDEIIELTDIVEKGTVPLVKGQGSAALESQMADLLSNNFQNDDNEDELDFDALLGDSLHQESDFPDDMFAGLDAGAGSLDDLLGQATSDSSEPQSVSGTNSDPVAANSADDVMDFDVLLQEMATANAHSVVASSRLANTREAADTNDLGDSSADSEELMDADHSDSSDDMNDPFLGDLDDVDNLLRDLMPPAQPSSPSAAKSQASTAKVPEVEEDDLATLLAGLDDIPKNASDEVDDLDALLDSIMSPRDNDAADAELAPEMPQAYEENAPNAFVGFDDLDALLGAAMQPETPKPVSQPTPETPVKDVEDKFDDLDALLSEAIQFVPPVVSTLEESAAADFDLDALLNDIRDSSASENESAGAMESAFPDAFGEAILDAELAAEALDLSDMLEEDTEADELLKGIFAADELTQTETERDTTQDAALYDMESASASTDRESNIPANGVDSVPDFDLDVFLADLDGDEKDAELSSDIVGDSQEKIAAREAEQNIRMQEIALPALSEELAEDDDVLFDMLTDANMPAESAKFLQASASSQGAEQSDILADIDFDEFPLDSDLGDPLLISDDSQKVELAEAVLQGLDLLAADIAAIQAQMAKLAPAESQQELMATLQGDFVQLHEDVQQLSERQAMSLAAVEARISDIEAQFAEKFAINSESMFDILAEQLAFMSTRLESLEAQPALPYPVQDDNETVRKLDHLSGIMVALEARLQGLENSQSSNAQAENDQADMANDVAKLLDRVEALELHPHENQDIASANAAILAFEMRLNALEGNVDKAAAEAAARVIREEIAGLLAEISDSAS